jgi:hypothetical protein
MSTPGPPPPVSQAEHEELLDYSPSCEPHEHLSLLLNQNARPWMTLKLLSEAPVGNKFPVYFDGGTVRGAAQIDLNTPQTIRSVAVEVSFPHTNIF